MKTNLQGKCPLCGAPNGCAVERGEDPAGCWCMSCGIPEALRNAAQEIRLRTGEETGCICRECVERYRRNPDEFKGRLDISLLLQKNNKKSVDGR